MPPHASCTRSQSLVAAPHTAPDVSHDDAGRAVPHPSAEPCMVHDDREAGGLPRRTVARPARRPRRRTPSPPSARRRVLRTERRPGRAGGKGPTGVKRHLASSQAGQGGAHGQAV